MSNQYFSYLLVGLCVAALAIGQVIFKVVGTRLTSIVDLFREPEVGALFGVAVVLYAASTLAWVVALRTLPLTQAYIFMSIGFVLVPLAAHFLLGEPLTIRLIVGNLIVILGILVAVT